MLCFLFGEMLLDCAAFALSAPPGQLSLKGEPSRICAAYTVYVYSIVFCLPLQGEMPL